MHNLKLWSPPDDKSILSSFIKSLDKKLKIRTYKELHNWSINNKSEFWDKIWD